MLAPSRSHGTGSVWKSRPNLCVSLDRNSHVSLSILCVSSDRKCSRRVESIVMSKPQACSWQHTVPNIMIYQTSVDFANSECIVASVCSIRSLHLDNVAFWCYRRHQNLGQTLFQDNVAFCFFVEIRIWDARSFQTRKCCFLVFFSTSESRTNVVFCVQEVTCFGEPTKHLTVCNASECRNHCFGVYCRPHVLAQKLFFDWDNIVFRLR